LTSIGVSDTTEPNALMRPSVASESSRVVRASYQPGAATSPATCSSCQRSHAAISTVRPQSALSFSGGMAERPTPRFPRRSSGTELSRPLRRPTAGRSSRSEPRTSAAYLDLANVVEFKRADAGIVAECGLRDRLAVVESVVIVAGRAARLARDPAQGPRAGLAAARGVHDHWIGLGVRRISRALTVAQTSVACVARGAATGAADRRSGERLRVDSALFRCRFG